MSVYVSAYVWEHSKHKGSELLLMLAIADIASRDGFAYPSMRTLARYLRMSQRNTRRVLRTLEASGEVRIQMNAGPKGTHLFQIQMNETLPLFHPQEGEDKMSPPDIQGQRGRTSRVKTPDIAMSAEPPGTKYKAAAAGVDSKTKPVDKSGAAAAAGGKLLYPAKLSSAQQETVGAYVRTLHPQSAQLLLDELEGLLQKNLVRDPMALFAHLVRQHEDGKFIPSHAHRVQAEREGVAP